MLTIPANKRLPVTVEYKDFKGNAAVVDAPPVWATSDPLILDVAAAADSMSAMLTPVGPLGAVQVTVTADADLGDGVKELLIMDDVQVVAGEAVIGALVPGTLEDIP